MGKFGSFELITSGPLENSHQSLKDEFAFETCFEAHSVRSKNIMMGKNVSPDVVVYVAVALATSDAGRHWPLMKNATMRVVGLDASPERGGNDSNYNTWNTRNKNMNLSVLLQSR